MLSGVDSPPAAPYIMYMVDSLESYDFENVVWITGSRNKMDEFNRRTTYPRDRMRPVVNAILGGATLFQSAKAGGFTVTEIVQLIEWGRQGHPAWEAFREDMLRADYQSIAIVNNKLKEQAESGVKWAVEKYYERKDIEYRKMFGVGAKKDEGGGSMIQNIMVQKEFVPQLPQSPGQLPAAIDVEGEAVDED